MGNFRNNHVWNFETIAELKAAIQFELDQQVPEMSPARTRAAQVMIAELSGSDLPADKVKRVLYCLTALALHSRYGGLRDSEVRQVFVLGDALLKSERILPGSRLAFLYGELHLVQSHILMNEGRHLSAAWEQQVSQHLADGNFPGGNGNSSLARGIRFLRIGHGLAAAEAFAEAMAAELNDRSKVRAKFGLAQALRLSGQIDQAEEALSIAVPIVDTETQSLDLLWEQAVVETTKSGNPMPLVRLTQRSGSHFAPGYVLEAKLWCYAAASDRMIAALPKLSTLQRHRGFLSSARGTLLDLTAIIEACYNEGVPEQIHLQGLGKGFAMRTEAPTVEIELLYLAAAARWLARSNVYEMARLVLAEYESLSLKLSSGMFNDVLNVVPDLLKRTWYRPAPKASTSQSLAEIQEAI